MWEWDLGAQESWRMIPRSGFGSGRVGEDDDDEDDNENPNDKGGGSGGVGGSGGGDGDMDAKTLRQIEKRKKRQLKYLQRKKEKNRAVRREVVAKLKKILDDGKDIVAVQLYAETLSATDESIQQRRLVDTVTTALSVFPEDFDVEAAAAVLHIDAELTEAMLQSIGKRKLLFSEGRWRVDNNKRQRTSAWPSSELSGPIATAMNDLISYFVKQASKISVNTFMETGPTRSSFLKYYELNRDNFVLTESNIVALDYQAFVMRQCIDASDRIHAYSTTLAKADTETIDPMRIAGVKLALAESYLDRSDYAEAEDVLRSAQTQLEQLDREWKLTNLEGRTRLHRSRLLSVHLLFRHQRLQEAEELLTKIFKDLTHDHLEGSTLMFQWLLLECIQNLISGQFSQARNMGQKAMEIVHALDLTRTPNHVLGLVGLGAVDASAGKLQNAEEKFQSASLIISTYTRSTFLTTNHCLDLEVLILEGLAKVKFAKGDPTAIETAKESVQLSRLRCIKERYPTLDNLFQETFANWVTNLRVFS